MNNEIKLKSGAVVKLINKEITGEQRIDVKKTYVATTKKEIVAKGMKYYQDKLNNIVMDKSTTENADIIPTVNVQQPETIPVVETESYQNLPETDNIILPNTIEEIKEEVPTVEEITIPAPLYTEEPIKAEIESIPEPITPVEQETSLNSPEEQIPAQEDPFFNTMNITLPSEELKSEEVDKTVEQVNFSIPEELVIPQPIPELKEQEPQFNIPAEEQTPEDPFFNTVNITLPKEIIAGDTMPTPAPEPINQNQLGAEPTNPFTNFQVEPESPVIEPVSLAAPEPIVFDASKENNLLNALSDKNAEVSNKAMLLNDTSLNNVRDFGEEPAKVNYQPNAKGKGFINSKMLTVFSIIIFLASCGFLVYEIFNYINVKK